MSTLEDVERQTGVPVEHLVRRLHLPENVPTDVPLRRLSSDLGFEMREVRRIVREYLALRDSAAETTLPPRAPPARRH